MLITIANSLDPDQAQHFVIHPANFVCGGVYCFHIVRASIRTSVRP